MTGCSSKMAPVAGLMTGKVAAVLTILLRRGYGDNVTFISASVQYVTGKMYSCLYPPDLLIPLIGCLLDSGNTNPFLTVHKTHSRFPFLLGIREYPNTIWSPISQCQTSACPTKPARFFSIAQPIRLTESDETKIIPAIVRVLSASACSQREFPTHRRS